MSLDIHQMFYLVNVVECGFNLSLAGRRLEVSQPALSQFINQFEETQGVDLFQRRKGRLVGLTDSGERIYAQVQEILADYEDLETIIAQEKLKRPGIVRVGLPSLLLRAYFSQLFPQLMRTHAGLQLKVTEAGSKKLRKQLIQDDLDLALMTDPTALNQSDFQQERLYQGEIAAYLSPDHPLAQEQGPLVWEDLLTYPLASFSDSFNTHGKIQRHLALVDPQGELTLTATTWSYLLEVTKDQEIISLLPSLIGDLIPEYKDVIMRPIQDPLPFDVYLCRRELQTYEPSKDLVFQEILDLF